MAKKNEVAPPSDAGSEPANDPYMERALLRRFAAVHEVGSSRYEGRFLGGNKNNSLGAIPDDNKPVAARLGCA
jgi:hypothetical protein